MLPQSNMPIEFWSSGDADSNMNQEILVQLADQVRSHPWWSSRTKLVSWLLNRENIHPPATVLDAGCGWGTTYLALEKEGYRVTGMDISERMLRELDAPQRRLAVGDLTASFAPAQTFDAVLAMDVIEHIDDDLAAARQLHSLVRPGGLLILSVPALPQLFSEFDRIQGHRRRYTEETLRETLQKAGFAQLELVWWGQLMYWLIRHQRSGDKAVAGESAYQTYMRYLTLPGYPVRWGIDVAFGIDRWLTRAQLSRNGTSLLAVARRSSQ